MNVKYKKYKWPFFGLILLAFILTLIVFSDRWKLQQVAYVYEETIHPKWSKRIVFDKMVYPNLGSGDFNMFYLVDVRIVAINVSEAKEYYEEESLRIGLSECHIDDYAVAHRKFNEEWHELGLKITPVENMLIISQRFPANQGIRRKPQIKSFNRTPSGNLADAPLIKR